MAALGGSDAAPPPAPLPPPLASPVIPAADERRRPSLDGLLSPTSVAGGAAADDDPLAPKVRATRGACVCVCRSSAAARCRFAAQTASAAHSAGPPCSKPNPHRDGAPRWLLVPTLSPSAPPPDLLPWLARKKADGRDRNGGSSGGARAAYALYFLLGAGLLAPWNALLLAADYYALLLPGRHVDRALTLAYLPVCLALLAAFARRPGARGARVAAGFGGFALAMLSVPAVRGGGGGAGFFLEGRSVGSGRKTSNAWRRGMGAPRCVAVWLPPTLARPVNMFAPCPSAARPPPHHNPPTQQLDAALVGADGGAGGGNSEAAYRALLAVAFAAGALDGACQGAVFGDAAAMPSEYTHVRGRGGGKRAISREAGPQKACIRGQRPPVLSCRRCKHAHTGGRRRHRVVRRADQPAAPRDQGGAAADTRRAACEHAALLFRGGGAQPRVPRRARCRAAAPRRRRGSAAAAARAAGGAAAAAS